MFINCVLCAESSARSCGEYQKTSLKCPFLKEVDQMLEHLLLSVYRRLRILICRNLVR